MAGGAESPRSTITEELKNPKEETQQGGTREDLEEGEIASEADSPPINKHPLENSWTFWFDSRSAKSKQAKWGNSIRSIYTFSTVEDFSLPLKTSGGCLLGFMIVDSYSLYNNIHHPSKCTAGADFYCFKNKIEPKWEDPVCANGGKWTVTYPRCKSDMAWLYTLLAMIGEQLDNGDEICGAVVNVRIKQDKISWTKNAANEAAQTSIGKQWKGFVDYNESIGFIVHDEVKKLGRNARKRYTA